MVGRSEHDTFLNIVQEVSLNNKVSKGDEVSQSDLSHIGNCLEDVMDPIYLRGPHDLKAKQWEF